MISIFWNKQFYRVFLSPPLIWSQVAPPVTEDTCTFMWSEKSQKSEEHLRLRGAPKDVFRRNPIAWVYKGWRVEKVRRGSVTPVLPRLTHIASFSHNVRFSVKGLAFHTHCWRKLTLPYLAEVQQIPTSQNCPNIEHTCLNLLKCLTNAPYGLKCLGKKMAYLMS